MPIHCAPSPPICVIPVISPLPSGLSSTIVWQPIPPPTIVPSGAWSDELCGQPEQKNGVRCAIGSSARRPCDLSELAQPGLDRVELEPARLQASRHGAGDQVGVEVERRRAAAASPCSSRLPSTRGAPAIP